MIIKCYFPSVTGSLSKTWKLGYNNYKNNRTGRFKATLRHTLNRTSGGKGGVNDAFLFHPCCVSFPRLGMGDGNMSYMIVHLFKRCVIKILLSLQTGSSRKEILGRRYLSESLQKHFSQGCKIRKNTQANLRILLCNALHTTL